MEWDYIVVGAGSAGCALVDRLVQSGRSVLLLEAGGSDRSPFIKVPALLVKAVDKYDWGYYGEPDPSRGGLSEKWYRGKVLGGSSSINGTKYVRPAAADFDRWAAQCNGAGGWSADEVMPLFHEIEASDQSGADRGHSGPLHIRTIRRPHQLSQAFVASATAAGLPFSEDYNSGSQEGVAYTQFTQRRGFRCSAADAFLKPNAGRKNLKVVTHAHVEKIEIEQGRAKAVAFRRAGRLERETGGHIVLCAGATNTPKLLMLSGIGRSEELKRHGIAVIADLPGVGRNFQDQPLLRVTYRTNVESFNLTGGLRQKAGIAAKYLLHGEGPVSNLFEAVAFARSSATERVPDIRLTFLALAYERLSDGNSRLATYPGVSISIIKSYPESRGQLDLASADPNAAPRLNFSLLSSESDVATLVRGIKFVRQDPFHSQQVPRSGDWT